MQTPSTIIHHTTHPTIIFTGGGSAGHVTPNLALIKHLQAETWDIHYIGSKHGVERAIVEPLHIPFRAISAGKLRREFSLHNLLSPFQVLIGTVQAIGLCRRIKPTVIFSKGGFVAFPVVFAGWLCRIPVIAHESDLTPGLANKLSFPFCRRICITFPEGRQHFHRPDKVILTGTPVRDELFQGDQQKGLQLCGFHNQKPVLMVLGGSLGSEIINRTIREILPTLLAHFQVIHICGKGKTIDTLQQAGYKQFEYVNEDMAHLYACTDFAVSRAGSNAIYELLSLKIPHLLIPLSYKASRGDQVVNAAYYQKQGVSIVLPEEEMNAERLWESIWAADQNEAVKKNLATFEIPNGVSAILNTIKNCIGYNPKIEC